LPQLQTLRSAIFLFFWMCPGQVSIPVSSCSVVSAPVESAAFPGKLSTSGCIAGVCPRRLGSWAGGSTSGKSKKNLERLNLGLACFTATDAGPNLARDPSSRQARSIKKAVTSMYNLWLRISYNSWAITSKSYGGGTCPPPSLLEGGRHAQDREETLSDNDGGRQTHSEEQGSVGDEGQSQRIREEQNSFQDGRQAACRCLPSIKGAGVLHSQSQHCRE